MGIGVVISVLLVRKLLINKINLIGVAIQFMYTFFLQRFGSGSLCALMIFRNLLTP